MKTLHPDLFPETLLVTRDGDWVFTTSLMVAEHYKKRHDNVIRDIEKLISDVAELGHSLLNFEERIYTYTTAKKQVREAKMYVMDRKAFSVLSGRFIGKEALRWQLDFYDAFEAMERWIHARESRYAAAFDQVRPNVRPVADATERGLSRAAIAEPLGKSPASVTYHRRQARRFGLLDM